MMKIFLFVGCIVLGCVQVAFAESLNEKLTLAKKVTDESLKKIFDRWQIGSFPVFLRSLAMTHTSWEILKVSW